MKMANGNAISVPSLIKKLESSINVNLFHKGVNNRIRKLKIRREVQNDAMDFIRGAILQVRAGFREQVEACLFCIA